MFIRTRNFFCFISKLKKTNHDDKPMMMMMMMMRTNLDAHSIDVLLYSLALCLILVNPLIKMEMIQNHGNIKFSS